MIDVSDALRKSFFDKINSCILTSATLKVQNSFDYFLRRVGLDNNGDVSSKEFLSPFYYNEQVTYYQYGGSKDLSNSQLVLEIWFIIYIIYLIKGLWSYSPQ